MRYVRITGYIWLEAIIDKLAWKHSLHPHEVVEVFSNNPKIQRIEKGHRPQDDLYTAAGQTDEGRYLTVFFIYKTNGRALVISARDMTPKERRRYGKK